MADMPSSHEILGLITMAGLLWGVFGFIGYAEVQTDKGAITVFVSQIFAIAVFVVGCATMAWLGV